MPGIVTDVGKDISINSYSQCDMYKYVQNTCERSEDWVTNLSLWCQRRLYIRSNIWILKRYSREERTACIYIGKEARKRTACLRNCKQFGGSALACLGNSGVPRETDWRNRWRSDHKGLVCHSKWSRLPASATDTKLKQQVTSVSN